VGRSIADEDDLLELLQQVVEIAHRAIDGADSAGVTIDLGGRTYTAVHTDARTLRVDSEQYDAGCGPCLDASRTGSIVRVDAGEADDRWPRFAAAARAEGILSFLAAPLFTSEQSLRSWTF
jgi:GAF domain-containing protein